MAVLELDSLQLTYLDEGVGTPICLLHGLGSCGDDWLYQMPVFAPHHRVVAPNLRGHTGSSPIRGPISMFALAADVAKMMDTLNIEAAHIVGLSLGGLVAQQLAIDFPHKVKRLVLCNTFAHLWPTSMSEARILMRRLIVSTLLPMATTARVVATDLFPRPDQAAIREVVLSRVGGNDLESYRHLIDAIRRFDSRPHLSRIQAPTLLITGDRDNVIPRGCQQQLVRGIRNIKWHIVRDSGHATPIDQPEEFNRAVFDFLKDEGGRRRDEIASSPSSLTPHPSSL